jgi:hypothetical protein
MATDTCKSVITYENLDDRDIEPFRTQRQNLAEQMFNEGKTSSTTNFLLGKPGQRTWVDHAAAQEFIDWVVAAAPGYNVSISSTVIVDF